MAKGIAGTNIITGNAAKTMTAADLRVVFNDKVVGFCTEINWTINYGNKPIYTIDSIIPAEFMPTSYATNFTMNGTRLLTDNFEDLGLATYPGINLEAAYMSIAVLERLSGKPVVNMKACVVNSIDTTANAKGLVTFSMSGSGFVALSGSAPGIPGFDGVPQQIVQ